MSAPPPGSHVALRHPPPYLLQLGLSSSCLLLTRPEVSCLYLWLLLLTGPGKGTRQSGDAQHPCFRSLALPLLSLLCSLGPWCTFSTLASHPLLSVCLKPPWLRKTLLPRFLLATQLFEFQVLLSLQDFFTGLASPTQGILISVHFCSF